MYGVKSDWVLDAPQRCFCLEDYEGAIPRWCPQCGDLAVLIAVQRLVRDEQIPPEQIVVVSGIGCSSRFPHYMKTYGFHGLHGRALPVACGVRSRRPDLHIWVATGDGDCCAIGTSHWIHALHYNMKMTVMLLDNNTYGLTKMQSSPTTPKDRATNTHPQGAPLSPLNPLSVALGVTNASFIAQTLDWSPAHVMATLRAAHAHPGLAFVRILQRCPHYMQDRWDELRSNPDQVLLLKHPNGIDAGDAVGSVYKNQQEHDPSDCSAAFAISRREDVVPIGLLYQNVNAEHYDEATAVGLGMSAADKVKALNVILDRFVI